MTKLSTGDDSTLENYRKLSAAIFGENSNAVKFIDEKISESPNGSQEEVLADERHMIFLLHSLGKNQNCTN